MASVIQAVPRLDFGSCLWPDLVHFRAQASIWKDGFNQRTFIAFRCGLGCKAEAEVGKQFLSKQPRARRYSRIQQLNTSASPWPLSGFWDFLQGLAYLFFGTSKSFETVVSLLLLSPRSATGREAGRGAAFNSHFSFRVRVIYGCAEPEPH